MALKCTVCAKGKKKAANRSHAKNKSLRTQKPNLQKVNGQLVCAKCMRTTAKQAA